MTAKLRYATTAEGKRLAATAREMGLDVAGVEFFPDGRVRVLDRASVQGVAAPEGFGDADTLDGWEGGAGASRIS